MTISIWRYSHLALALSSFCFLALASITGAVLALEPISEKVQPYNVSDLSNISVADLLSKFENSPNELLSISVDENHFVILKEIDANGNTVDQYINPESGQNIGKVEDKSEFFQWVTNLHRSLFLKETGRILMGVASFLLFLIAVSGTILIIKRQRGVSHFFAKIVNENFAQYYHVVLGRLSLIPIIIVALTGSYLTFEKLEIFTEKKLNHAINYDEIKSEPKLNLADFKIFKSIFLSNVEQIEFPFSDDPEDYFTLKYNEKEVVVNQYTGEILSEVNHSIQQKITRLGFILHTGSSSFIWAIILFLASINILFFIYSGFKISLRRIKSRIRNRNKVDDCEIVILVGSENGTTMQFASALQNELISNGKQTFIAELNDYTSFAKAEKLIILTATYGLGEAPTNAEKFLEKLDKIKQTRAIEFSVLGFGSKSYPEFCKFAFEVHQQLCKQSWAKPLLDVHTVNDKSPQEFEQWLREVGARIGVSLKIPSDQLIQKSEKSSQLTVVEKTEIAHVDGAFLIKLRNDSKTKFVSGDLLALFPANDHRERLYSIGKVDNQIQLSVKLHPKGLGSSYLYNLEIGNSISGVLRNNKHFHFPKKAPSVIMISNGTGIAPFLGMIDENKNKSSIHLYCGFRNHLSYELYKTSIEQNILDGKLDKVSVSYSREEERLYVKDLILQDAQFVLETLVNNGVIMICGSLAMQKMVLEIIDNVCLSNNKNSFAFYQSKKQILSDCY